MGNKLTSEDWYHEKTTDLYMKPYYLMWFLYDIGCLCNRATEWSEEIGGKYYYPNVSESILNSTSIGDLTKRLDPYSVYMTKEKLT